MTDDAGVDEAAGQRAGARGEVEDFGIGQPKDGDGRIEGDGGIGTVEVGGVLSVESTGSDQLPEPPIQWATRAAGAVPDSRGSGEGKLRVEIRGFARCPWCRGDN